MLTRYLKDLLYREEQIVIPDFGTFTTEQVSARIDEDGKTFYPPTKKLNFNSSLTENDGLLAHYIASVDKISYESALNFIKFEVGNWVEKLKNEDVVLPELGTFSKDVFDHIIFSQSSDSNFLTTSFGLSNFEGNNIKRSKLDKKTIEITDDNVQDFAAHLTTKSPKKVEPKPSTLKSVLKYVAIFALLLGIGWLLLDQIIKNNDMVKNVMDMKASQDAFIDQNLHKAVFEIATPLRPITLKIKPAIDSLSINYKEKDSINLVATAKSTPKTPVSILNPTIPKNTTIEKKSETAEIVPTPTRTAETTSNPVEKVKLYHVIAGSFKGQQNALNKVVELRKLGYANAIIVDKTRELHQVSYGSFSNPEEAQQLFEKIKKEDPEVWILEK